MKSSRVSEIESIIADIEQEYGERITYKHIGPRDNNFGQINIGIDPGKSIVERLTNAIDANLEREFELHKGLPVCDNPRDAAMSWLDIPVKGSYLLTAARRRELAKSIKLVVEKGEDKAHVNILIIDEGIGVKCSDLESTILDLGGGNKVEKPYLMGAYGQGGSSTFAFCKYSIICSKPFNASTDDEFCFTVVFYENLPPEKYKHGRYVYLALDDKPFRAKVKHEKISVSTIVKHYGFELGGYRGKLGPYSIYGLLQRALFDPVIPIVLDDKVHNYLRVIKGSRNALNAAADEEIDERGPSIRHNVPMYSINVAEFGTIGLEYWVLEENPAEKKYDPIVAYVDNKRPILFTLNGQTHAEFPVSLIKKEAELPFLKNRLIVHVDCNNLSPSAKRSLFSSNREDIRKNELSILIIEEIVRSLKSDDELKVINEEARNAILGSQDVTSEEEIRKEVAKLLHLYDFSTDLSLGGMESIPSITEINSVSPPVHPPRGPRILREIELHDPPTYMKILNNSPTNFYKGQRRYIRIECDAFSQNHDPEDLKKSKFNIIINGKELKLAGTTPLKGGRLRLIIDCDKDAQDGNKGELIVELSRFGLPVLTDIMQYEIIQKPVVTPSTKRISVPKMNWIPIDGPHNPNWQRQEWPENPNKIATSSIMDSQSITIYYSTIFPAYKERYDRLSRQNVSQAQKFAFEYRKWIGLHSILLETQKTEAGDSEEIEVWEQEERCRLATLSCMTAEQFVSSKMLVHDIE